MKTKIIANNLRAEESNALYAQGYRYTVRGEFRTLDTIDPWSGMPDTTSTTYAFTDKAEAEAYAKTQKWVFNPDDCSTVEEIPAHRETWEELLEKQANAKTKREITEKKNAEKMGLTVEQYRKANARKATRNRLEREIAELEEVLKAKKATLEKYKEG